MNYEGERKVELAAKMAEILTDLYSEPAKPLLTSSNDLRFYGAVIFGLCAVVVVLFSKTHLVWSLIAPCALGMIIGVGLVVAEQFSLRSRLVQISKYFSN